MPAELPVKSVDTSAASASITRAGRHDCQGDPAARYTTVQRVQETAGVVEQAGSLPHEEAEEVGGYGAWVAQA